MALFTVLGARGFIGGHLAAYLRRRDHEVGAPDRGDPAVDDRDLGHVVFCIGLSTDYWKHPLDTAEAHVGALIPLLRSARFERLVYLSSVRLYDGLDAADETGPLRLDPRNPRHIYDLSKGLGEALLHHSGRPAVAARLASVYDDALAEDDFMCRTVRQALSAKSIEIDASPEGGRDYIHIDDVCAALEAIALGAREPAYNIASGVTFTNRDLATLCERELGCRITFRPSASANRSPTPSIVRLERDFAIRPQSPAQRLPSILRRFKSANPPSERTPGGREGSE